MSDIPHYSTTGKPHPFYLVRPSIMPLLSALAAGVLALGAVFFMHDIKLDGFPIDIKLLIGGFVAVLLCMYLWWNAVVRESVVEKAYNPIVEVGLRYGMALFIASEVMFFVAFFWAFFDASLFVNEIKQFMRVEVTGGVWPPQGMTVIDPLDLPLLMTMILLLSGCTVTWAHHALLHDNQKEFRQGLGLTVLLGVVFLGFQVYEYAIAPFKFTDGIYASTFYMATGFHGFHVLIGTIFLFVCYLRAQANHFTADKHFGFEAAAWYWHFVDVVWLFLFVGIYFWGNIGGTYAVH